MENKNENTNSQKKPILSFNKILIIILLLYVFVSPYIQIDNDIFKIAFIILISALIGLIGYLFKGDINLKSTFYTKIFLTATGQMALFVFMLLFNSWLFLNVFNNKTFNQTIYIEIDSSIKLSNDFPKITNDSIILQLENNKIWKNIPYNREVDYKDINSTLLNASVPIELKSKYWTLISKTVKLQKKAITVFVTPSETLKIVTGTVKYNKKGLNGALVECVGEKIYTDSNGNFQLVIPLQKQKTSYKLEVSKLGFIDGIGYSTPETNEKAIILLSPTKK